MTAQQQQTRQVRDIAWLLDRVVIDPATECWEWTRARNRDGYGQYCTQPAGSRLLSWKAHRLALELALGRPILPGMLACHRCNNPPCVNPAHLYEGTGYDNTADRIRAGTATGGVGERNGNARLTDGLVREIKIALIRGETGCSIAQRLGVTEQSVSKIKLGRQWRHITITDAEAWFYRTAHCYACGEPGVFCTCTEQDPCGCRDLHEMGSALLPGAVAAFSDAPVVEQPDLFGDA